jgi:hypothetical protein
MLLDIPFKLQENLFTIAQVKQEIYSLDWMASSHESNTLFCADLNLSSDSSNTRGSPVWLYGMALKIIVAMPLEARKIWGIPCPVQPPIMNNPFLPGTGPSRGSLSLE